MNYIDIRNTNLSVNNNRNSSLCVAFATITLNPNWGLSASISKMH